MRQRVNEYVRQPIPEAALQDLDGNVVLPSDLTRSGAALLVFLGKTDEAAEVSREAADWGRSLRRIRVVLVVAGEARAAGGGYPSGTLVDPHEQLKRSLIASDAPTAVLLGIDGLLAGGPVIGLHEIRSFVDDIDSHFAETFTGPRVLVTSAATGRYRSPRIALPQVREGLLLDVDFICFTEESHPSREHAMHPRLAGKIPKMLAWETNPGYDYYLWLDSIFTMSRSDAVGWFVDHLGDHDAAFFRHNARTSIAQELDFVMASMRAGNEYLLERYEGEDMAGQVAAYLSDPTFDDSRLMEAGAFIYSSRIVRDPRSNVMKEWFYQNCRWSVQDQLSLPYVLHQFGVDVVMLDAPSVYECEYLR